MKNDRANLNDKRVIFLDNPLKPESRPACRELLDWLTKNVQVVAHNLDRDLDLQSLPTADVIIVMGGDGTMLATARELGHHQLPIIGVNMGKLGFLAEFSVDQIKEQLPELLCGHAVVSERIMLDCHVVGPNKDHRTTAVNEIAIVAGPPFRMIEVSVCIGQEHLALCAGDGLIVATPNGSTAYNLSAGGPILAGTLQAAVITPLAAHSLSFRPIVVTLDEPIVLQYRNSSGHASAMSKEPIKAVVAIDGQENMRINKDDRIIITKAEATFKLVRNVKQGRWKVLNTKLNWGALPNYSQPFGK